MLPVCANQGGHRWMRQRRCQWTRQLQQHWRLQRQRVEFEIWNSVYVCIPANMPQRGRPCYEYYRSFRKELEKHADNWCTDLDTLRRLAKEEWDLQLQTNELRPAILARVPAETAMEWGYHSPGPLVAVCVCGNLVLCRENSWWTHSFLENLDPDISM